MNLPTCPREDCTATIDHTHVLTTGNPYPCFLQVGGSCSGHESDRNDSTSRCYAPRTPQPQPYRFPDGWERGHEAKYWLQTGLTPYGLTLDPERAPGVLNWLGVNYYTPDSPHLPQPAAVVLPTVGRDDVRKGDRLRVVTTWEGVLSDAHPDALYITADDGGVAFWDPNDDETVTYLLHRPEPEDPRVAVVKEWLNNTREGPADLLARLDAMGADR